MSRSVQASASPIRLRAQAVYSIGELARVAGIPAYRLLRMLRRCGVPLIRVGRSFQVSIADIQEKIPPLWRGICVMDELRATQRGAP